MLVIAHAEIEAIQMACKMLNSKKLNGCVMYVNAESCAMCATAIIKSGIVRVFYGAPYEEGSSPNVYLREINEKAKPKLEIFGGIMQEKFNEQIQRGRKQQINYFTTTKPSGYFGPSLPIGKTPLK